MNKITTFFSALRTSWHETTFSNFIHTLKLAEIFPKATRSAGTSQAKKHHWSRKLDLISKQLFFVSTKPNKIFHKNFNHCRNKMWGEVSAAWGGGGLMEGGRGCLAARVPSGLSVVQGRGLEGGWSCAGVQTLRTALHTLTTGWRRLDGGEWRGRDGLTHLTFFVKCQMAQAKNHIKRPQD